MTAPPAPEASEADAGELPGGLPFATTGAGPPLVVLPGLARRQTPRSASFRALSSVTGRRVWVVNRPNGLQRGVTMEEVALAHVCALESRFSDPVDVLGISTGGTVALQLAVDHPHIVRRLVVVAAASWLGTAGSARLRQFGAEIERGKTGARTLAPVLSGGAWRWLMIVALWVAGRGERRLDPRVMLATIDAESAFDVTARLGEIRATSLVIAGGRDRAFPIDLARATAAGIPRSRLIVYPRAGHLGTMLHPRFGSDVAAFLNA